MSAFSVYGWDYTISGHEYRIVPAKLFITLADWLPHSFARPKSANFKFKS
jgi:hypothetical protein